MTLILCSVDNLDHFAGAGDLHADPRARRFLPLPLRIRTFPLFLQQGRLFYLQSLHGNFAAYRFCVNFA